MKKKIKQLVAILFWPIKFLGINLYVWLHFPFVLLPHPKVKKGDQFLAVEDIKTIALLHFDAPFTGGFNCTIPKGTVLIAFSDSDRLSLGFGCVPENPEEFKNLCMKECNVDFSEFSFSFKYNEIGKRLKRINV